ncbi:hypothetical protein WISP_41661 [Willisornis vidua]|uniref:Uncharacterized protein n=1 Tax=Willisornis vidua TaxID=1566151 RepID=A0ABQ9DGN0_9PASS|nr:hypothetical protein WISP_41661 [Willisornis vidua]
MPGGKVEMSSWVSPPSCQSLTIWMPYPVWPGDNSGDKQERETLLGESTKLSAFDNLDMVNYNKLSCGYRCEGMETMQVERQKYFDLHSVPVKSGEYDLKREKMYRKDLQ